MIQIDLFTDKMGLDRSFAEGNLLKALDEYNYCVYTKRLQLRGPT